MECQICVCVAIIVLVKIPSNNSKFTNMIGLFRTRYNLIQNYDIFKSSSHYILCQGKQTMLEFVVDNLHSNDLCVTNNACQLCKCSYIHDCVDEKA